MNRSRELVNAAKAASDAWLQFCSSFGMEKGNSFGKMTQGFANECNDRVTEMRELAEAIKKENENERG